MLAYTIEAGRRNSLEQVDRPRVPLGPHEVRVAVHAAALNFRDIQIARGSYDHTVSQPIIPLTDAAGEVIEVGSEVKRFKIGSKVLSTFFPRWIDGPISSQKTSVTYGATTDGVLAEEIVRSNSELVHAPETLSALEAATLTCAGVTAWNALFVQGVPRPGARVLILGTGGVAIWALQLAVAAGLDPIVTSSSDGKLEIAKSLGARDLVNYRTNPDWQDQVMRITGGRGADVVLEVGGENTLPRSIAAAAAGGKIIVIGGLSGFGGAKIEPHSLIFGAKSLTGVAVGSRTMLEDLSRFVDRTGIKPVVAEQFSFKDVPAAYEFLEAGKAFGKVVVDVAQNG